MTNSRLFSEDINSSFYSGESVLKNYVPTQFEIHNGRTKYNVIHQDNEKKKSDLLSQEKQFKRNVANVDLPTKLLRYLETKFCPSEENEKYNEVIPLKLNTKFITYRNKDIELYKMKKEQSKNDCLGEVLKKMCTKFVHSSSSICNKSGNNKKYNNLSNSLLSDFNTGFYQLNKVKTINMTILNESDDLKLNEKIECVNDNLKDNQKILMTQHSFQSNTYSYFTIDQYLVNEYSSDMFDYLMRVETRPIKSKLHNISRSWVINWFMYINGRFGDPAVLQTACWYLDEILLDTSLSLAELKTIGAACFWIAQKLYQPGSPAAKLVQYSYNFYTANNLKHAERTILNYLNFPPKPVVSHDYIPYFAWVCGSDGEVEMGATFITMSALINDSSLCIEYPSVVAAAAIRNAIICLNKEHLLVLLEADPVYQTAVLKATNFQSTCSAQRIAVRVVSADKYPLRRTFNYYGPPPLFIAQRIKGVAEELYIIDAIITGTKSFLK